MSHRIKQLLIVLPLIFSSACTRAPDTDPRMVSEWMHTLYGVVRSERIGPPVASRLLAYLSIALYEGMAAATPALPTLAGAANGITNLPSAEPGVQYDATLVAVEAERAALDSFMVAALPSTRATLGGLADSLIAARTELGLDPAVVERSLALGRQIGNAVVAASRTDGFAETRGRPYAPPSGPGLWYNDAPGALYSAQSVSGVTDFVGLDNPANTMRAGAASDRGLVLDRPKDGNSSLPALNIAGVTEPFWREVRPFFLRTWNECTIADPPAYSTDTASAMYRDAREVYDVKAALTPEEHTIALYWADNPGETGTPAGHWISIASQMISERQLSAAEAARLFAATATAQSDAFVAGVGVQVPVQPDPPAGLYSSGDRPHLGARHPDTAVPRISRRALHPVHRCRWGGGCPAWRHPVRRQHQYQHRTRGAGISVVHRRCRRGGCFAAVWRHPFPCWQRGRAGAG